MSNHDLSGEDRDKLMYLMERANGRIQDRVTRIQGEDRDATDRELSLSRDDAAEVQAIAGELDARDHTEVAADRGQQVLATVAAAHDHHEAQLLTRAAAGAYETFDQHLRDGVAQRVVLDPQLFMRAATAATTGQTSGVFAPRNGTPRFIWSALGMAFEPASTDRVQGPTWQPLAAQAATPEGGTKPVMVDAVLDSQSLGAYAVTHTVSDRVLRFGAGEGAVSSRLAAEAVFSANAGIIDRFETVGTELVFTTDAQTSLDAGIAEVVSRTGGATGIIVNAADYPAVASRTATSAADVESGVIAGYNGLPLFLHPAMTAGHAIVVNGAWLTAVATGVLLASLPKLETNEVVLRAEVYAAVLVGDASAVQRVDVSAAA